MSPNPNRWTSTGGRFSERALRPALAPPTQGRGLSTNSQAPPQREIIDKWETILLHCRRHGRQNAPGHRQQ
jgi:hypothetical protein